MILVDTLRRFFHFLGKDNGILFTNSVEFLIFSLIAYIVISEYMKRRSTELKISSIAFLIFSLNNLLMMVFQSLNLFSGLDISVYEVWLPLLDHFLESLALIVLANAIVYPVIIKKIKKNMLVIPIIALCITYIIAQILWFFELRFQPGGEFHESLMYFTYLIIKSAILFLPLYLTAAVSKRAIRYRFQIFAALLLSNINDLVTSKSSKTTYIRKAYMVWWFLKCKEAINELEVDIGEKHR